MLSSDFQTPVPSTIPAAVKGGVDLASHPRHGRGSAPAVFAEYASLITDDTFACQMSSRVCPLSMFGLCYFTSFIGASWTHSTG